MSSISDFIGKASRNSRSPLGIIALFISLVYGFACLVLSVSLDHLKYPCERLPLIWFIIIFPILILLTFIYLVINHHTKLYSPSDFKDENNFIKSIGLAKRQLRLEQEIETIREDIKEGPIEKQDEVNKKESSTTKNEIVGKTIDTKAIKDKYVLAEILALNKFEEENNVSLQRHSKLVGLTRPFEFDAIGIKEDTLYCIDVKYTIHKYLSKILQEKIEEDIPKHSKEIRKASIFEKIKLIVIIVSENPNPSEILKEVENLGIKEKFDFHAVVYSIGDLKRHYGIHQ